MSELGVKSLFIDFGRLTENEGMNKSGTGLGLSICKQIIENMGGSVEVKSELGVGSEFIINLKVKCKRNPQFNTNSIMEVAENSLPFIYKKEGELEYVNLMHEYLQSHQV